jgi:hypothetical protein
LLAPQVGLPPDIQVEPYEVDLSTVQAVADKVFRLREPHDGFLHIEPQTSWENDFALRLHAYNALIDWKHGGPVYSVVLLLRRDANMSAVSGVWRRLDANGQEIIRFRYGVLRVWELSAETLLSGPLGATPMALLTQEAAGNLRGYVDRLEERMRVENVPQAQQNLLLTSSYILLGMLYNDVEITNAFARTDAMKESTTYQAILREGQEIGHEKGLEKGRRDTLQESILDLLRQRFGSVPVDLENQVSAVQDVPLLKKALLASATVPTLSDFTL